MSENGRQQDDGQNADRGGACFLSWSLSFIVEAILWLGWFQQNRNQDSRLAFLPFKFGRMSYMG
jgi:hypothetical protein